MTIFSPTMAESGEVFSSDKQLVGHRDSGPGFRVQG